LLFILRGLDGRFMGTSNNWLLISFLFYINIEVVFDIDFNGVVAEIAKVSAFPISKFLRDFLNLGFNFDSDHLFHASLLTKLNNV
jgi:hypothetical protein